MVDYRSLIDAQILKQAGLSVKDVELSIRLARAVSEAIKLRRSELRKELHKDAPPSEEEQAEDDRLFLGAAFFLAQRMKRKSSK